MKRNVWLTLVLLAALSAAGCTSADGDGATPNAGTEEQEQGGAETGSSEDAEQGEAGGAGDGNGGAGAEDGRTAGGSGSAPTDRPETIEETIALEGMEEPITLRLYEDEGLGFYTYVPEQLVAESSSSGEGDGFVAYAAFGGNEERRAALSIFAPAGTYAREGFSEYIKEIKRSSGFDVEPFVEGASPRFEGSFEEFGIGMTDEADGMSIMGTVALLERNGRMVAVTLQYPEDYAEGFVPRAMRLYEHIVWDEK